jgi:hypothetical protein
VGSPELLDLTTTGTELEKENANRIPASLKLPAVEKLHPCVALLPLDIERPQNEAEWIS